MLQCLSISLHQKEIMLTKKKYFIEIISIPINKTQTKEMEVYWSSLYK